MSDITLADFWGVKNVNSDIYNYMGTSLVIVRSEKGRALLEQLKDKFFYSSVNLDAALKYNGAMVHSAKRPNNRQTFFENVKNEPFKTAVNKCCKKTTLFNRIMRRINKIFK